MRLQYADGSRAGLGDLLVALDIRYDGRYYYGSLIGLTDDTGFVSTTGRNIEEDFAHDRHLFPMDYRIDLAECDPVVVVRILGGEAFLRERTEGATHDLMTPAAKEMWRKARNAAFRSAAIEVELLQRVGEVEVPMLVDST